MMHPHEHHLICMQHLSKLQAIIIYRKGHGMRIWHRRPCSPSPSSCTWPPGPPSRQTRWLCLYALCSSTSCILACKERTLDSCSSPTLSMFALVIRSNPDGALH